MGLGQATSNSTFANTELLEPSVSDRATIGGGGGNPNTASPTAVQQAIDLAKSALQMGDRPGAEAALGQATAMVRRLPWDASRDPLLEKVAQMQWQLGRLSKTLEQAKQLWSSERRQVWYSQLAIASARGRNVDQAELLLLDIDRPDLRIPALLTMAETQLALGQAEKADLTFQRALKTSQNAGADSDRLIADSLARYAKAGRPKLALGSLRLLNPPPLRSRVLLAIAMAYQEERSAVMLTQTLRQLGQQMQLLDASTAAQVRQEAIALKANPEILKTLDTSRPSLGNIVSEISISLPHRQRLRR
jgi:tetratricopeptide (TPR) repeat protein